MSAELTGLHATDPSLVCLLFEETGILGINGLLEPTSRLVGRHEHPIFMSPENSHFSDINLLGGGLHLIYNVEGVVRNQVKIYTLVVEGR